MILILMGAPAAGKGTQAEYLKSKGFAKISTGDLFRREIKSKTQLGMQVEETIRLGKYVSDEILLSLMKKELESSASQDIVLDGFPRTIAQAEWLDVNADLAAILHIDVAEKELLARVQGRLVCSNCGAVYHKDRNPPRESGICDACHGTVAMRSDDSDAKVFLDRLNIYRAETEPLLEYYKKANCYYCIDGNRDASLVRQEIDTLLETIR